LKLLYVSWRRAYGRPVDVRVLVEPQQGATYDDLLVVARVSEDAGFDGFFCSDHYLAIAGPGLPGPTDAWLSLAGLARETSRVRLGTLMSPVTFRLPGPLAIQVAQLDQMSQGRIELGLGAGWYEAEHSAYGSRFRASGALRPPRGTVSDHHWSVVCAGGWDLLLHRPALHVAGRPSAAQAGAGSRADPDWW
jgi:alkanesulfonate monooxygenase SsuD/methylene tetrahydromethanopterin reductase-like flavin-dependent oxidoreductase (luciferase family)